MARKSRKQIQVAEHLSTEFPMTVGYARLSVNDRVESRSIENQKKIIALWAEQHELLISKFYVDTGYSGSTFQRPAFQQLLQDISAGKIQCVIVKDDCVIIEPTQKDLENQGFVAGSICF